MYLYYICTCTNKYIIIIYIAWFIVEALNIISEAADRSNNRIKELVSQGAWWTIILDNAHLCIIDRLCASAEFLVIYM